MRRPSGAQLAPPSRPVVVSGLASPVLSETSQMFLASRFACQIRNGDGVDRAGAVRRELRLADALHREEIGDRDRLVPRPATGADRQRRTGQQRGNRNLPMDRIIVLAPLQHPSAPSRKSTSMDSARDAGPPGRRAGRAWAGWRSSAPRRPLASRS